MYKAIGVDAKSEFAYEGQKLGQRSLSAKNEKICTTVKQLYLFISKHLSFQAKFCMLIVISLKNIEKMFFITEFSYVDFKMGQRSSSAIMGAFLQTVFLFFSLSNNKMLFKPKKGRSLSECLN